MLKKSFIRSSFFYFATPVLVIKKFEKNLRVCINYRILNVFIIKNRNCFLLIKKIFVKLCAVKYYIKLNVIAIFNEIQIRKNNKKKQRFLSDTVCTNTLLCFSIFAMRSKYFNFISTKFYKNI